VTQKITKALLLIIIFIFILGLFSVEIKDPDFWWHLKTGEYISQTKSLPETDPFAFTSTPKDPLSPESVRIKFILTQYWLAQVLFSWIYQSFGFQGIIFLRAFILTLLVFLIYRGIRREGTGFHLSIALTIPAVLIMQTFTGERPQLFSFLFSFLIIFLLEGFKQRSRRLKPAATLNFRWKVSLLQNDFPSTVYYLLPTVFIMFLWANMHGGFIVGIALLLCYLVAEWIKYFWFNRKSVAIQTTEALLDSPIESGNDKKRGLEDDENEAHKNVIPVKTGIQSVSFNSTPLPIGKLKLLSGVIIVSVLFSLINPNTYTVIPFLVELESGAYKGMIVEAMSPVLLFRSGFYEIQFFIFFALLFVSSLFFLVKMKNLDLTDVVVFTMLAVASLSVARFIPFFAPLSILMIARYGQTLMQRVPKVFDTIMRNIEVPLNSFLIIVLILMLINGNLFKQGIRGNKYPEGAARFLKENRVPGNMFNPYVWGGYLIWALYPEYKVFIDGRGLIPEVFFQEVRVLEASQKPVEGLPEWKAFLNAYKINFIIAFSVGNFSGRLVPLIHALLNDPEWHLVYMDNISLVFVRDSEDNSGIIRQFSFPKEWLWNEVAVEAALKAKDSPNRGNYYETMGDAFFAKRSYIEAREAYTKALDLKPGNTRLRNQIDLLESIMRSQGQ